jgi:hypothetical protein
LVIGLLNGIPCGTVDYQDYHLEDRELVEASSDDGQQRLQREVIKCQVKQGVVVHLFFVWFVIIATFY